MISGLILELFNAGKENAATKIVTIKANIFFMLCYFSLPQGISQDCLGLFVKVLSEVYIKGDLSCKIKL